MPTNRVEYQRAYFQRNKARICANQKELRLKRRYGLSQADYDALLASQDGGCAICGKTAEDNGQALHVDHDHKCCPPPENRKGHRYEPQCCGRCIRGLLCWDCNTALGKFREDPAILEKAIAYIGNKE